MPRGPQKLAAEEIVGRCGAKAAARSGPWSASLAQAGGLRPVTTSLSAWESQ